MKDYAGNPLKDTYLDYHRLPEGTWVKCPYCHQKHRLEHWPSGTTKNLLGLHRKELEQQQINNPSPPAKSKAGLPNYAADRAVCLRYWPHKIDCHSFDDAVYSIFPPDKFIIASSEYHAYFDGSCDSRYKLLWKSNGKIVFDFRRLCGFLDKDWQHAFANLCRWHFKNVPHETAPR